ncbi:MAG: class I SAM-dependent methyltransferase [Sedimentisphaerales bacterium]|nr:class I SAM-dependent methyltransferase [Sedimentisphaerales bacterium]
MEKYLQSCKSDFWKEVFQAESDYILRWLGGAKDILSVGCGPAIIEKGLAENGFNVTGLDISEEALDHVPDSVRTAAGSAEKMNFADCSFDAAVYIASLQFIEGYKQAVKETARVLKSAGKLLIMLLNPQSGFFKERIKKPDSYVNRIKHTDLKEIEKVIAGYFFVETEYFLGIKGTQIFQSEDIDLASLYIIKGTKLF